MAETYANRDKFANLAKELKDTGDPKYDELVDNLANLEYDDFLNEKFATPKVQMVADLRAVGLEEEATRVMNGDYDQ